VISIDRVRVWERLMLAAALVLEEDAGLKGLVDAQEHAHAADLDLKRMISEEGMGRAAGGG
jgi:hypothetical protein